VEEGSCLLRFQEPADATGSSNSCNGAKNIPVVELKESIAVSEVEGAGGREVQAARGAVPDAGTLVDRGGGALVDAMEEGLGKAEVLAGHDAVHLGGKGGVRGARDSGLPAVGGGGCSGEKAGAVQWVGLVEELRVKGFEDFVADVLLQALDADHRALRAPRIPATIFGGGYCAEEGGGQFGVRGDGRRVELDRLRESVGRKGVDSEEGLLERQMGGIRGRAVKEAIAVVAEVGLQGGKGRGLGGGRLAFVDGDDGGARRRRRGAEAAAYETNAGDYGGDEGDVADVAEGADAEP
jgi:hypothetical protein